MLVALCGVIAPLSQQGKKQAQCAWAYYHVDKVGKSKQAQVLRIRWHESYCDD